MDIWHQSPRCTELAALCRRGALEPPGAGLERKGKGGEGQVSHPLPSRKGSEPKSRHNELLQAAAWTWTSSGSRGGTGVVPAAVVVLGCSVQESPGYPQVYGLRRRWTSSGGVRAFQPKKSMRLTDHKER